MGAALSCLSPRGFTLRAVGLGNRIPSCAAPFSHPAPACEGTDVLLLPMPVTRDGLTLACPLDADCVITPDCLAEIAPVTRNACLLGGCIPPAWMETLTAAFGEDRVTDYASDETLLRANAALTAEGALMTLMEQTDKALSHLSVAVIGCGRIGKELAARLPLLGAQTHLFARRPERFSAAAARYGCELHGAEELARMAPGAFDALINTVPVRLLSPDGLPAGLLILDLASPPGFCDPSARASLRARGIRLLTLPSLPGRYAPVTAGELIAEAVCRCLIRGGETT